MIDIVIPLRNDSKWNNNEIRYCLRSVEKHLTGIRDVYIIGYKPDFIQNVKHIPMRDHNQWVTVNIRNKVLRACDEPDISEDFLFMNDDHYLMPDFDRTCLYYSGNIAERRSQNTNSIYSQICTNTIEKLGPYAKFYDVHTPIIFNKGLFNAAMNQWSWEFSPTNWSQQWGGWLIKTVYVHFIWKHGDWKSGGYDKRTQFTKDGKIRNPKADWADISYLSQFTPVISSSDIVGPGMVKFLERMFPNKSKYEI